MMLDSPVRTVEMRRILDLRVNFLHFVHHRLLVEENSSRRRRRILVANEKKEGSVSTTVATFGSFVAFLVGTAVGTVAMWYKHKRTRARALGVSLMMTRRWLLISDAVARRGGGRGKGFFTKQ